MIVVYLLFIHMEETVQSSTAEEIPEMVVPTSNESSKTLYIPSSTEKKRAVMMYMLIGIIVVGVNTKTTDFEQFHLKQALGWWAIFLLTVIVTSFFIFIPLLKYIPIFIVVVMVTILGICIKKARDGKYSIDQENKLSIFLGLGEWILTLFEVKPEEPNKENLKI